MAVVFGAGCISSGWGNGNAAAVAYVPEGATVELPEAGWGRIVALFLASDEAGYITRVCLPTDGGISLRAG